MHGVATPENGIRDAVINDGAGRVGFELCEDVGEVVDDRGVVDRNGDGGAGAGLGGDADGAVGDQAATQMRGAAEDADGLGVFDDAVPVAQDGVVDVHDGIERIDAIVIAAGEDAVADFDLLTDLLAMEVDAIGVVWPAHVDEPAVGGEQGGALNLRAGAGAREETVPEREIRVDAVTDLARGAIEFGVIGKAAVLEDDRGVVWANDRCLSGVTFAGGESAACNDRVSVVGGLGVVMTNLSPALRSVPAGNGDGMRFRPLSAHGTVDDQPRTGGSRRNAIDQHERVGLNGESRSGGNGDGIRDADNAAPDRASAERPTDGGDRVSGEAGECAIGRKGAECCGHGGGAGAGECHEPAANAVAQNNSIGG